MSEQHKWQKLEDKTLIKAVTLHENSTKTLFALPRTAGLWSLARAWDHCGRFEASIDAVGAAARGFGAAANPRLIFRALKDSCMAQIGGQILQVESCTRFLGSVDLWHALMSWVVSTWRSKFTTMVSVPDRLYGRTESPSRPTNPDRPWLSCVARRPEKCS